MSILLAMTLAGAIYPSDFDQSIAPGDFPLSGSMAAVVDFAIDARGRPLRCAVSYSTGDTYVAKSTCPILMHKHFTPAKNASGENEYFVTRDIVKSFLPGTPQGDLVAQSVLTPQMEIEVAALPGGKQSMFGALLLEIDQSGKAISCNVRSRPEPLFPIDLCKHLDLFTMPIEHDADGNGVRYITTLRLKLTVKPN